MTRQDALTLVDYHYWARERMLEAVDALTPEQYTKDLGSSFKSVRDTVVHTFGAEWNWYQRWVGKSPTAMPEPAAFPDRGDAVRAPPGKHRKRNVRPLVRFPCGHRRARPRHQIPDARTASPWSRCSRTCCSTL